MSTCVNQLISVSNKLIFAAADSFNIQTTPLTVVRYNGKGWVLGEGCCDGHIFGHGDSLGSIAHKTGNLVLVAPAIHVVASVGGGDNGNLCAVVHAVGAVAVVNDAGGKLGALVVDGHVSGGNAGGVGVGDDHLGGVDAVDGDGAAGPFGLDGASAGGGALVVGATGGDAQHYFADDLAVGGGDGGILARFHGESRHAVAGMLVGSVCEVEVGAGVEAAACADGHVLHLVGLGHFHAAPVAVVGGEGEGGFGGEVGGEGHVVGAHGEGLLDGGVAVEGGLLIPVDEVVGRIRGGDNFHLGAGQDEVGVLSLGSRYAVGVGGGGAVVDGDLVNLDIIEDAAGEAHAGGIDAGDAAVAFRNVSGAADDGAGAAADCRDVVMAKGHVELDAGDVLAVCRGDGDGIVVINLNAVVVASIGAGDGEVLAGVGVQPLVGGEALALLLGAGRVAVEAHRAGAVAVGGEGEGVWVEDVDGEEGRVAQVVVVAVEDHVDGVEAGAGDGGRQPVIGVGEGDDAVHAAVAQAYGAALEGSEEVFVHAGADAADDGQLEAAVGRQALGGHGGGVVGPCQGRQRVVGHVERGVIVGHGEAPRAVGVVRHRRRGVGRVAVDLDGGDADHLISVAVYMAVGGFDRDVVCAVT